MILLIGGTSDANHIADQFKKNGILFKLTVTSEYGEKMAKRHNESLMVKKFTQETLRDYLVDSNTTCLIDASHPHAAEISSICQKVSQVLGCRYLRYERPSIQLEDNPYVQLVQTVEEAIEAAKPLGNRVLLLGSKHLKQYCDGLEEKALFARIIPDPKILQQALDYGIPSDHILAMKGPFTEALNRAVLQFLKIDVMITKESGVAGGFFEKREAAINSKVHLIVIRRPKVIYSSLVTSFEALLETIQTYEKDSYEKI